MESPEEIWRKMLAGEKYYTAHTHLLEKLSRTRILIRRFNDLMPDNLEEQKKLISALLGSCGNNFTINQPFRCDYGENIHIGENFFANFNLTILDEAEVRIGDNAFIGPNVSIYTACHPLDAAERNELIEWARPVTIGNNVWMGGNVTIVPGVTIGDNCVIGAGSVVTRDIPSNTVAAGNPARVIKSC